MSDPNLQLARGGAEFSVELFKQLNAATSKQNIIVSPFSIQTCMGLVFAGAKGDTAEEIATVMKYSSNSTAEVAATFQNVLEQYKDSELLKIANKIYVQAGRTIKADYAAVTKEQYHAGAETINFGESEAATGTINTWVEDKTAGKISNLIPPGVLDGSTRLVLLNALHFKGDWQWKFDEEKTQEDDFWVGAKESIKVKYMNQKAKFGYGYFSDYNCTALEMPYKDSDLSMFVLLPDQRDGLKDLALKLKDVNLVDLSKKMSTSRDVTVKFPKFKIDYSIELSKVLHEMGITKAFGNCADFSNMLETAEGIYISKILHKACIEVNEEGSEAAAATAVVMKARCAVFNLAFMADRPFFYWIWNKKNIMFAGAFVNAPAEA